MQLTGVRLHAQNSTNVSVNMMTQMQCIARPMTNTCPYKTYE